MIGNMAEDWTQGENEKYISLLKDWGETTLTEWPLPLQGNLNTNTEAKHLKISS